MSGQVLTTHDIVLTHPPVLLRPTTEADLDYLLAKWNDPEMSPYGDPRDAPPDGYNLEWLQEIYASISKAAFCFIIEYEGKAIGDCWLQKMNLPRIIEANLGKDCRRIDLMMEKARRGKGIGTGTIALLSELGFIREKADAIFGVDISGDNTPSIRVFEKNGFVLFAERPEPPGSRTTHSIDMVLTRERYLALRGTPRDADSRNDTCSAQ